MDEKAAMRMRVLVVDDEPTARQVLRLGVERLGCEVVTAEDAVSAIALLSREHFHAVITDKNMPGTDHRTEGGLDVIRFAKRVNPGCAVLMITGFASLESAIEAMQLGAFDYITKPVRAEELKAKLDRVVQYQQTIDPAGAFAAYSSFRDEFLAILDQEAACQLVDQEAKARVVEAVQRQIDRIFQERRQWEQLIFEQREALTRIAAWVEELREHLPAEGRVGELLARIGSAVNHRV
ncbi:MAG: response regulator [Thermodesulfobacteriota bacterium]